MARVTAIAKPVTVISGTAARLSFAAAALFVISLAALHVIKPELDPSWRFISEYAIGDNGWIMALAFLLLALSHVSLFVAVRPHVRTMGGYIGLAGAVGLALLLVAAAGLALAGIFTTDPITASPDEMTVQGNLHSLGGTLGIAAPFAAALISYCLARNPAWSSARRSLIWSTVLTWIGFLVSFLGLGFLLSQSGGQFGPGVPVGWPTRFEILTYSMWLMVVAWGAIRLSSQPYKEKIVS